MSSEAFDLVAARLEQAKRDAMASLNADLFASRPEAPIPPLTRRERLALRLRRVHVYFSTLWDALRGRDPYDCDWDY